MTLDTVLSSFLKSISSNTHDISDYRISSCSPSYHFSCGIFATCVTQVYVDVIHHMITDMEILALEGKFVVQTAKYV